MIFALLLFLISILHLAAHPIPRLRPKPTALSVAYTSTLRKRSPFPIPRRLPPYPHHLAKRSPHPHHHHSIFRKIKSVFHKLGNGIKHIAEKAAPVLKKIAHVATAVESKVLNIAGKVAGYVPGVGRFIKAGIFAEKQGLDAAAAATGGGAGSAREKVKKMEESRWTGGRAGKTILGAILR